MQKGEDVLGGAVGGGQYARARLGKDLRSRQVGGFGGEVGIADGAFTARDVLQGDRQTVGVGVEGVLLEGAELAAEDGDLADRALEDGAGGGGFAVDDGAAPAGDEVADVTDVGIAELAGGDGLDADAHLLAAADLGAELEERAAAGDDEAGGGLAEGFVEG